jgi:hypothetical protein
MKRVAIIFMCLICLALGACMPVIASAEQTRPLKIWYENSNGYVNTYCLVDSNTGVNYIVVAADGPESHGNPAITPRLNADGSLYVTK